MTPQSQRNSSLTIQWCLLDPYGRIRVVGSWLLVPGAVSGHRNCAHCWGQLLIFNPSFAENKPSMTPQNQRNSFLSIQWCLLDPYRRIRVVGSCLLGPWDCHWPQKLCWLLGSIDDFQPKSCWKLTQHDTTEPMKLFLDHTMVFVGSIWKNKSGWFLFFKSPWLSWATEIVLAAGAHHWFSTQVLLKINTAWHHRTREFLPYPYDGVCWIHMEE
jgi:hypothetical protein